MIPSLRSLLCAALLAALPACEFGEERLEGQAGLDQGPEPDGAPGDARPAPDATPDATPDAGPEPELPPPGAPGPFRFGFSTETIEYPAPGDGAARPLDLHWWYPTAAEEGARVRYGNLLARPEALGDAPPDPALADAPVLVFSHGNGGFAEQSYFLCEFLASHGFVVVAPDHTGNTFLDSREPIWRLFELRPADIQALLDHVDTLPADHPLAGRLSPSARALAGHSFGGYTTLAVGGAGYAIDALLDACQAPERADTPACAHTREAQARYRAGFADPRLQALIPMTPAGANLFGGDPGLAGLGAPTLMFTAGRDATLPNPVEGDPLWAGITHPGSLRLDLPEAGHFTFSDACSLPVAVGADDGCGPDFLPVDRAHPLINAFSLAFLRRHLLGDDRHGELLEDPEGFAGADVQSSQIDAP